MVAVAVVVLHGRAGGHGGGGVGGGRGGDAWPWWW